MQIKNINFQDKKFKIAIIIVAALLIIGLFAGFGVIKLFAGDDISKEDKVANAHFYAFIDHDWDTLYDTMTIPKDQQYMKKEIFLEQMELLYPANKSGDYRSDITSVQMQHTLNEDETAMNYVVNYKENEDEKVFEFTAVLDENKNIKVTPDHLTIQNFKINIPNNTDISINNERVNEKYRTELLPTEQRYEVSLFKGIYPVILKMEYGKTKYESLYVGVMDENGKGMESYEVEYFEVADQDEKEIIKKSEEFIRSFFVGISKKSEFSYNVNKYNPAILEAIETERSKYMESLSAAYSLNNVLVENIKINSKGLVSCDVSFDLKSGTNAEGTNSVTQNWKLDLKKDGKEWIIQGVDFTKEAENEQS